MKIQSNSFGEEKKSRLESLRMEGSWIIEGKRYSFSVCDSKLEPMMRCEVSPLCCGFKLTQTGSQREKCIRVDLILLWPRPASLLGSKAWLEGEGGEGDGLPSLSSFLLGPHLMIPPDELELQRQHRGKEGIAGEGGGGGGQGRLCGLDTEDILAQGELCRTPAEAHTAQECTPPPPPLPHHLLVLPILSLALSPMFQLSLKHACKTQGTDTLRLWGWRWLAVHAFVPSICQSEGHSCACETKVTPIDVYWITVSCLYSRYETTASSLATDSGYDLNLALSKGSFMLNDGCGYENGLSPLSILWDSSLYFSFKIKLPSTAFILIVIYYSDLWSFAATNSREEQVWE